MGRQPQLISKVPFKVLKPMQLSEVVPGSMKSRLTGICFDEISVLFLCLKTSGFNQEACPKEIANFQKCYNHHFQRKFLKEPTSTKKKATPGAINTLLKRLLESKIRAPLIWMLPGIGFRCNIEMKSTQFADMVLWNIGIAKYIKYWS